MGTRTPFSKNRFEYEGKHLYYLPPKTFALLEQSKPVYLIGTRGTGKTTLLQALNWQERLVNKSLQLALNDDPFGTCYLGVYLKPSENLPNHFDNWLSGKNNSYAEEVFSLWIDLKWTEQLSNSIATLLIQGPTCKGETPLFNAPPSVEHELIQKITLKYPSLLLNTDKGKKLTLKRLSYLLSKSAYRLENEAVQGSDPKALYKTYPLGQIGHFGRFVGKVFGDFCNKYSTTDKASWYFKVCIDEAEWYSDAQEIAFNTMIRLSKWPVCFVLSYVRDRESDGDIFSTVNSNITVGQADREIINLDYHDDDDDNKNKDKPKDLYEGVAQVRIREELEDPKAKFDLRLILGSLDINALLEKIIKNSKNRTLGSYWLSKAADLVTDPFWENVSKKSPLIYQAYQVEKLALDLPQSGTPEWERREQKQAEIRKRMVASYLCLCREFKKRDIIYAYADMVFGMSDGCIRDFILQLNEIYIDYGKSLRKFLKGGIKEEIQCKALESTSYKKRQNIPRSRIQHPLQVGRIIDGLGHLTYFFQSELSTTALLSNERGRFVMVFNPENEIDKIIFGYIIEAAEAGYIRIKGEKGHKLTFQLHCSLAASFKFSYRGAYSETKGLCTQDLNEFLCNDQAELEAVAEKIYKRISKQDSSEQPWLFKETTE